MNGNVSRLYQGSICWMLFIDAVRICIEMAKPVILGKLLSHMQAGIDGNSTTESSWRLEGTCWVLLLVVRNVFENFVFCNYVWFGWLAAYKIVVCLQNAVFGKSLRLNSESKSKSTLGRKKSANIRVNAPLAKHHSVRCAKLRSKIK